MTKKQFSNLRKVIDKRDSEIDDDPVFLLQGDDFFEIYVIDDKTMIEKLQAKIKELKGHSETEISRHLLRMVNPKKYGNG
jgi:hypothetical protein